MQLVKQAGLYTGTLLALSARRTHAIGATIEVLDSLGAAAMTFRLIDVTVVSQHLALAGHRLTLQQQGISQQESLSSLSTDYQEALRQLATAEELGKNHVGTRLDLARDRASDLQRRMDLLRVRLGQTVRQLGGTGVEETIVLHSAQLEVETRDVGGRATIHAVVHPRSGLTRLPEQRQGRGSGEAGAFPSAAMRFRKIRAAPGTPAGSCRNSASVL